jgi:ABC-2 type transport system permease protein
MSEKSLQHNFLHDSRIVYWLFRFGMKDVNESLTKFIADFIIACCRLGVMLALYFALFEYKGGEIMGVNFQTVSWGMFLYFVFMYIAPRYLSRDIQMDIQTGRIESLFSKPVNYIYYKLGEYLGTRFVVFLLSAFLGFTAMMFFIGTPANILTWNFVWTFPIVVILCFILTFQFSVLLGLISFWVEDVTSIRWLMDKTTMILGGAYFPVAFFPPILKTLSLYTPFGASQFITYAAYESWQTTYLQMFGMQIFWIIVFGVIIFWVQKKAFSKLSVNGG